jgi:DNA helicase HerA-like ATPase
MSYPSLKERLSSLAVNAVAAYVVFFVATDQLLPTGGLESVWLVCAVSYWFLSLLSAPWFIPPRDAIISAVGAILVLTTMDLTSVATFAHELNNVRWSAVVFSGAIIVLAVSAVALHEKDNRSPLGHFSYQVSNIFGRGEILFSAPAIISIVSYYQISFEKMSWLILFWILLSVGKPIERLFAAIRQFRAERSALSHNLAVGQITRVDHPDIVRVRLSSASSWRANKLFTASLPDGTERYVLSLFAQTQGEEVVGTGLCVATLNEPLGLPVGAVSESHDEEKTLEFLENLSGAQGAKLVGFVVENSTIGVVSFEVSSQVELREGEVVFARLSGKDVFYQIVAAETREENFDQNPRGTHVVQAAQLGIFTAEAGFSKYGWLPPMNTPLFSAGSRQFAQPVVGEREFAIGKVPSTNIEAIARIDELVEYHTAILGVTGTGKTELAMDVVRQAIARGTKVFCVDFTGDYRARLGDLSPAFISPSAEEARDLEAKLFAVETGTYGAPAEKKALQEGVDGLRAGAEAQIEEFLRSDNSFLGIFELAEIANTKATLRLTELYLSTIMHWAQQYRRERQVLIVLEEAHTIVPEVFSSGFDANTQFVVSRIGQIALQGRKYGVGLMVISQRTALVSKTILSQCNTFFTYSLIDQTSLKFLESVYSARHTKMIPNLGRFEFLAFGKAIKAERPIVLKREFDPALQEASLAVRSSVQLEEAQEYEEGDEAV